MCASVAIARQSTSPASQPSWSRRGIAERLLQPISSLRRRTGSVPVNSGRSRRGSRVSAASVVQRGHDVARSRARAIERIARPRRGEVAPLRELPRRLPQPVDRPIVAAAKRRARAAPGARLPADRRALLEPAPERLVEEAGRRGLGQHLEQRIDAGLDRPLAQQIGAEAVDRADVRLLELRQRMRRAALARHRHGRRATRAPSSCFAQPQFQLAGGLLGERDRDDLSRRPSRGRRDDAHDAVDERGRLAGAGRGLDDERGRRGRGDELAGLRVAIGEVVRDAPLMASLAARPDRRAVRGLPRGVARLVRAADGAEVTPRARALARAPQAGSPSSMARSMISSASRPARRFASVSGIACSANPPAVVQ